MIDMTCSNDLCFLEPPHSHSFADILTIAALPLSLTTEELPGPLHDALYRFLESISIAFASIMRLVNLVQQRFGRLIVIVR